MTASTEIRVMLVNSHSIMRNLLRDALETPGNSGRMLGVSADATGRALTDPESPSLQYSKGVTVRRC